MTISALMEEMAAAGAPLEAIIIAVKAIEARDQAERARKDKDAARKRRKRGMSAECPRNVRAASGDSFPDEDTSTPSGTDLPGDAVASPHPSPRQPVTAAMDFWNENAAAVGWRTITARSAARQKATAARLREHGLEGWKAAIGRARASPYLSGADPPGWFTFDWFTKSGNFIKVAEGNYDRKHNDTSDPTAVALSRLHAKFGGDVRAVT